MAISTVVRGLCVDEGVGNEIAGGRQHRRAVHSDRRRAEARDAATHAPRRAERRRRRGCLLGDVIQVEPFAPLGGGDVAAGQNEDCLDLAGQAFARAVDRLEGGSALFRAGVLPQCLLRFTEEHRGGRLELVGGIGNEAFLGDEGPFQPLEKRVDDGREAAELLAAGSGRHTPGEVRGLEGLGHARDFFDGPQGAP